MNVDLANATLIARWDTSAASLARARFERTGERTSPYTAFPERETYEEVEVYDVDGVRAERRRTCARWGGVWAAPGPWSALSPT